MFLSNITKLEWAHKDSNLGGMFPEPPLLTSIVYWSVV